MRKILFYGNCQTGVLGEWIHNNYPDTFEVFDCKDCGLEGFGGTTKNFAVFSPENKKSQHEYYRHIHEKIKQADILVFVHIEHPAIDELKMEYLHSEIARNQMKICIPNTRFLPYPICHRSIVPYVRHVYKNISQQENVMIDYLLNNNDDEFHKIFFEQLKITFDENRSRHERNLIRYENVLEMDNFIEQHWSKHLLFGTLVHPIGLYWSELITKLFKLINEQLDQDKLKTIDYPSKDVIYNITNISFCKNILPNIVIPTQINNIREIDKSVLLYPFDEYYK